MNIIYNHPVSAKELELFRLIEEFIYTHLNDKSIFYLITVNLHETDSRGNALLKPTGKIHFYKNQLKSRIDINNYVLKLYSNSCIRCKDPAIKSHDEIRLLTIFHEFAHLVDIYNDPKKLEIEMKSYNALVYNKKVEEHVDKLAMEFLESKGIVNRKEDKNVI